MGILNTIKGMFGIGIDNLSAADFKAGLDSNPNAVLLDVRTAAEVSDGKIPGAKNINVMSSDFQQKVSQLDKSKAYYVYCRSGARSGQACSTMKSMGFEEVYNLGGGIMGWPYDVK